MKFQLVKTQAHRFGLQTQAINESQTNELQLHSLNVAVRVPEVEVNQEFAICFTLQATALADYKVNIECEFWAVFTSDEPLTAAFLDSHFTSVNAPAIAYPYLRSYISSSLVNAGYPAMHLPTLNFVERSQPLATSQLQ